MKLGFKGKIIVGSIVMISLTAGLIQSFSLNTYRNDKIAQVKALSNKIIEAEANKIESWIHNPLTALEQAKYYFNENHTEAEYQQALTLVAKTSNIKNLVVGLNSGEIYSSTQGLVANSNAKEQSWYQQAKSSGKTIITDVTIDAVSNNNYLYIATPVNEGVLATKVALSQLDTLLKQVHFPGAIVAVYDNQMRTVASTGEADKPGQKLSSHPQLVSLEQAMLRHGNGSHELELMGVDKVSYFREIPLTSSLDWHMLIALDKSVAYAEVNEAIIDAAIITIIMSLIAIGVLVALLNHLYKPINELKSTVEDLASGNGDLTRQLAVHSDDDLGQIAQGVNQFITSLRHMMLEVETASQAISAELAYVKGDVEKNNRVLGEHAMETDQVVTAITEMNAAADSVAQNAANAAHHTRNTHNEAQESKAVVNHAVTSVGSLVKEVDAMSNSIQKMSDDTQSINAILQVIGDISEQTNLLALNAAIEAARAGEQGRGFAVVADEVRALAGRTRTSTDEINDMLTSLTQASSQVVSEMQITKTSCEQAAENTAGVSEHLDNMSLTIADITDIGDQIATAAEEQSTVADDINRNMTKIRDMVNELVANGDNTLVSTNKLADSNTKLADVVGQFKLK